jgi:hypothetical protein
MADPHLKQWESVMARIPMLKNNTDCSDKDFEGFKVARIEHVQSLINNEKISVQ